MTESTTTTLLDHIASFFAEVTRPGVDVVGVMRIALEFAQEITRADGAVIAIADEHDMVYHAATGLMQPYVGGRVSRASSLSGLSIDSGRLQVSADTETDPRVDVAACRRAGVRSIIAVPLAHRDLVSGVLKVTATEPNHFGEQDIASISLIAGVLAIAIRRAEEAAMSAEFQRSLAASEQRWRSAIEQNISGIYLVEDGRFIYANNRFLQMLGYTLEQLLALPRSLDLVAPEDRARAEERLRSRAGDEASAVEYEVMCARGDDGRRVLLQVFTTTAEIGGTNRIIGTAIDVTARSAADTALRHSEEWFRRLIEGASDMIGVLTLDGIYTYCSPSVFEHLGYDPSELVGRSAFEFIHQDDLASVGRELAELPHRTGRRAATRLRFRHANRGWVECAVSIRIERDPAGSEIVIANSRDVTDEHRLHQQVADAERLASLGRVASSMAHEFNNVLMAIQPFADVIARVRDAERLRLAASSITNAVRRGRTITQQILRFTRGEAPERRTVPIAAILGSVQRELASLLPANIHLDSGRAAEPGNEELYTFADAAQVEQLLVNLALNARDAMPEGGTISLTAAAAVTRDHPSGVLPRDPSQYLHITMLDSGVGIPEELLPRIFEPLFTTKKAQGGSGLGLTIAQQIAAAHDGALFVESHVGAGTKFDLFLPRVAPPKMDVEGPRVEFLMDVRRLLLVEDDDFVANGVIAALEALGLKTDRVSTGAAAIGGVEAFRPDVVLLDYGLPDITGAQVYAALRERWPTLPIVFATGHADAAALRSEIGNPDVEICFKPFNTNRLLEAISRAVAN